MENLPDHGNDSQASSKDLNAQFDISRFASNTQGLSGGGYRNDEDDLGITAFLS